ncbi:MAG: carbon-nitrogen hydrolase family protein [Gemmatimonadaceae bacterium]
MRVTVCELSDDATGFARDWDRLASHVSTERSELVLLPEMPFFPWFAGEPHFDPATWQKAVDAHEHWLTLLPALAPAIVLGTRPVNRDGGRLNEAFVWNSVDGYRAAHHKYFLPNEDGFWEAQWYSQGDATFGTQQCGQAMLGFQICTELWALDQSRIYGLQGAHIIAVPRATPHSTLDKWVVGGQAAAVCAGAYCLSSNHVSSAEGPVQLGGQGWVMGPDAELLALTSREQPIVTVAIDLAAAEQAKTTYPRYVFK